MLLDSIRISIHSSGTIVELVTSCFFFFKQKAAIGVEDRLVGSEMGKRDRSSGAGTATAAVAATAAAAAIRGARQGWSELQQGLLLYTPDVADGLPRSARVGGLISFNKASRYV